jgi:6-pyruvoyl-tetrahydropterin synthase
MIKKVQVPDIQRVYKTSFEMAHVIKGHPVCGIEHGHSYRLTVYFDGFSNEWVDFHDLKDVVDKEIKEKYDHKKDIKGNVFEISAEMLAFNIGNYLYKKGYSGELELYETDKYGVKIKFGSFD